MMCYERESICAFGEDVVGLVLAGQCFLIEPSVTFRVKMLICYINCYLLSFSFVVFVVLITRPHTGGLCLNLGVQAGKVMLVLFQ